MVAPEWQAQKRPGVTGSSLEGWCLALTALTGLVTATGTTATLTGLLLAAALAATTLTGLVTAATLAALLPATLTGLVRFVRHDASSLGWRGNTNGGWVAFVPRGNARSGRPAPLPAKSCWFRIFGTL